MRTLALALSLSILLAASIASADALAATLADGQPWTIDAPMGGTMGMVFAPDGTGRVGSRLLGQDFTWTVDGNVLCIAGLPGAASGCMQLVSGDGGFVGQREDGQEFRLWR